MKLWLKKSVGRASKRVGWRNPQNVYEIKKGHVFYVDKGIDIPDKEAEILLKQNAHLLTASQSDDDDEGEVLEGGDNVRNDEQRREMLKALKQLAEIDDLESENVKVLRPLAKKIGLKILPTMKKELVVKLINDRCAQLASEL